LLSFDTVVASGTVSSNNTIVSACDVILMTAEDGAAAVTAAIERRPVLDAARDGPVSAGDVQDVLDVSRSTAHRVVRELAELGLLVRENGGYRLTAFGDVTADATGRAVDAVAAAGRVAPVLDVFEDAGFALDPAVLREASVTRLTAADPYRPVRRLVSAVSSAGRVREFDRTAPEPAYQRAILDRADAGCEVAVLYPPSVVASLEADDPEAVEAFAGSDCVSLRVGAVPPARLVVADDHVYVGSYGRDTAHLQSLVDTTAADAVAWASGVLDAQWTAATPYTEFQAE
jgi:predicted transcriptional regulator